VRCENCRKQITKKEDVNVLAFLGVIPKYFCNDCYSSKERGFWRHFTHFPKQPINSKIYKVGLWILTCFVGFFAVIAVSISVSDGWMVALPFSIAFLVILLIAVHLWIIYFIAKRKLSGLK